MDYREGFVCSVTKRGWPAGNYLVRRGHFHRVAGIDVEGFRGVRRLHDVARVDIA